MDKKRMSAKTGVALRVGTIIFLLWFVCMTFITIAISQYVFEELTQSGFDLAGRASNWFSALYLDGIPSELLKRPGMLDYRMLDALANNALWISPAYYIGGRDLPDYPNVLSQDSVRCQTASLFLDKEGNLLYKNSDYLYFWYETEEEWLSDYEGVSGGSGGWIDISKNENGIYDFIYDEYKPGNHMTDYRALKLVGYFDGVRFVPYEFYSISDDTIRKALNDLSELAGTGDYYDEENGLSVTVSSTGTSTNYSVRGLVSAGLADWEKKFDISANAPEEKELETIYILHPNLTIYDKGDSITYRGEKYDSLLSLLETMTGYRNEGSVGFYNNASQLNIFNTIVFTLYTVYDLRYYDGGMEFPDPEYIMLAATQASPLLIAMKLLVFVYVATLFIAVVAFRVIFNTVNKRLIEPMREVNGCISSGWTHSQILRDKPPVWEEPYELSRHYSDTQDTLRFNRNEITRLNTSLKFAKDAEENRRKMTSNIAHELKTPLAVIRSYAEGIKENIAEEKRDKYLDVIISETERMDGMVLEMLDLSRLESGRVKLSVDEFSLKEMVLSIFDKLSLAAEAKNLKVEFIMPDECIIKADESRIGQVVENFASNAVKYTPVGGNIKVRITQSRNSVTFSVENDSTPLSAEELSKVWDTFYRTDESRTSGGTGLGLAIAKNIIELHGGRCGAVNTKNGVEFRFTI